MRDEVVTHDVVAIFVGRFDVALPGGEHARLAARLEGVVVLRLGMRRVR